MNKNAVMKISLGNIEIKIAMYGFYQTEYKRDILMHSHRGFEFHSVMLGGAVLEYEGGSISVETGDSLLVFPDVYHRFSSQEDGSAIISFSFYLERTESNGYDYYSLISRSLKSADRGVSPIKNREIFDSLKKIMPRLHSSAPFADEEIRANLILLFSSLFTTMSKPSVKPPELRDGGEYDARIMMIENYFNEHYTEEVSLSKLAKLLHLSEKQTDRMIKRTFGRGFTSQLLRIRIKSAKELLTEGSYEIKAIAEKVGYRSYNGFYLAFKKLVGVTPEEYRRAHIAKK